MKKNKQISLTEASDNLFADVGFDESEAKELQFRSFLMNVLVQYIRKEKLTQKEAAEKFIVTQSRISNLVRGKIDLFSSSMLLLMLERAGFKIYENIQTHAAQLFAKHSIGRLLSARKVSIK